MSFEAKTWRDYPNETTPITADELNRIENRLAIAFVDRDITNGSDLDEIREAGIYRVRSNSVGDSLLNWPFGASSGWLIVLSASNGICLQLAYSHTGSIRKFVARQLLSVQAGTFMDWEVVWDPNYEPPTPEISTGQNSFLHNDLLIRAEQRKQGKLGTSGKSAVALRIDHHLEPFRDKVLPLLEERDLPFALVLNPERTANSMIDDNVPWETIQDWCVRSGSEVWNHGGNHRDVGSTGELYTQVVESKKSLQENLPKLPIDGWAPPGLSAGGYLGAAPFSTPEENSLTEAGQLITKHHAFVAGYGGSLYRPLVGKGVVGARHTTIDKATVESIETMLLDIEGKGEGLALMLHPNYLDSPDYISTQTFENLLDLIVQLRDEERIEVLSYSGLWVADSTINYRPSLLPETQTEDLTQGYTTRWHSNRRTQLRGGTFELRAKVNTTGSTTLSVSGEGVNTQTTSDSRVIRKPFTLPLDHSGYLTFNVSTSTSEGTLESLEVISI